MLHDAHDHRVDIQHSDLLANHLNRASFHEVAAFRRDPLGVCQGVERLLQGTAHLIDPRLGDVHVRSKHARKVVGREQVQLRIALQCKRLRGADQATVEGRLDLGRFAEGSVNGDQHALGQ